MKPSSTEMGKAIACLVVDTIAAHWSPDDVFSDPKLEAWAKAHAKYMNPSQVFEDEQLSAWAKENGWVKP
jgi:hypothetical protein